MAASDGEILTLDEVAAYLKAGKRTVYRFVGKDPYSFDHHRLDMLVYRLRRKLSDANCDQNPLLTSRGTGYLFLR